MRIPPGRAIPKRSGFDLPRRNRSAVELKIAIARTESAPIEGSGPQWTAGQNDMTFLMPFFFFFLLLERSLSLARLELAFAFAAPELLDALWPC